MTISDMLKLRLGYKESVLLTRDEFDELEAELFESQAEVENCSAEIAALEGVQKQLNLACETIDGIIECIDDEGVVTPGDIKLLARRIKAAAKFIANV